MEFHHIGIIVKNIEAYEKNMVYEGLIAKVYDPIQMANLSLYKNFGSGYLELIQPLDNNSFTYNFLVKYGEGFHHLCYRFSSEEEMMKVVRDNKLVKIRGPVKALLFNNADVYFYFTRNKTIIEFLIQ